MFEEKKVLTDRQTNRETHRTEGVERKKDFVHRFDRGTLYSVYIFLQQAFTKLRAFEKPIKKNAS